MILFKRSAPSKYSISTISGFLIFSTATKNLDSQLLYACRDCAIAYSSSRSKLDLKSVSVKDARLKSKTKAFSIGAAGISLTSTVIRAPVTALTSRDMARASSVKTAGSRRRGTCCDALLIGDAHLGEEPLALQILE